MVEMKVTITGGRENLGEEIAVSLEQTAFAGRSHEAAIRFANDELGVSAQHLAFSVEGGRVWVKNLRRPVTVNGKTLETDARCEVHVGDSFEVGPRARFRVDALEGLPEGAAADAPSASTGATRALDETIVLPEGLDARALPASAAEELPEDRPTEVLPDESRTTGDATTGESRTTGESGTTGESRTTGDSTTGDSTTGESRTTGDSTTGNSNSSTGSGSGSGTSAASSGNIKTVVLPQSLQDIYRKKVDAELRRRRRVRQTLLMSAFMAFVCIIAAVIYVSIPRAERWLSMPRIAGTTSLDWETQEVSGARGKAFVVFYPKHPQMVRRVLEGNQGFEINTLTGRDRDVPFRLCLKISASAEELTRSLEACAQAQMAAAEKDGVLFLSPLSWPAGIRFFENDYEGSSHRPHLLRGTPFYRSEYETVRSGRKWHGVMLVFRDGEQAYTMWREIPDAEWARGLLLLRTSPNLEFFPDFQAGRWESPGRETFLTGLSRTELTDAILDELNMPRPRVALWPRLKRAIDTLIVQAWSEPSARRDALSLLARFRRMQDRRFVELENEFDLAIWLGQGGRKASIWRDARRIFGEDPSDRRATFVNNPEMWSSRRRSGNVR